MKKIMVTAIIDEDIFDELCTYPEHRVRFLSDAVDVTVTDDIFSNGGDRDKPMKPIRQHYKRAHRDYYLCPMCGEFVGDGPRNDESHIDISNYCGKCGQKMGKGGENNESVD